MSKFFPVQVFPVQVFPSLSPSSIPGLPPARNLRLLDWMVRQTRPDKPGAIPADLAPILDRLGIKASAWPETVNKFTSSFGPFAGRPESLAGKASRLGRHWLRGVRQAAATFN